MQQNLQQQIRSIRIVHIALMTGVIFFILISAYMVTELGGFMNADARFADYLLIVFNLLTFAAIPAGLWFFKRITSGIAALDIDEKLIKYRLSMIIRAATIEGPCFMFILGFMLTGMTIFLIEAMICFILLAFFYPTKTRLQMEMQMEI